MAEAIYLLCVLTSLACAVRLLQAYRLSRARLLLWSGVCFAMLALNNILVVVDRLLLPHLNLLPVRTSLILIGFVVLLYGFIAEEA